MHYLFTITSTDALLQVPMDQVIEVKGSVDIGLIAYKMASDFFRSLYIIAELRPQTSDAVVMEFTCWGVESPTNPLITITATPI